MLSEYTDAEFLTHYSDCISYDAHASPIIPGQAYLTFMDSRCCCCWRLYCQNVSTLGGQHNTVQERLPQDLDVNRKQAKLFVLYKWLQRATYGHKSKRWLLYSVWCSVLHHGISERSTGCGTLDLCIFDDTHAIMFFDQENSKDEDQRRISPIDRYH